MATKTEKVFFSDLPISMIPHPVTGDVNPLTNEKAIQRSLRNIVMTNHYERRFNPSFGGNVTHLIFELAASPFLSNEIEARLKKVIQFYEPRVSILSIVATEFPNLQNQNLEISIAFVINNTQETGSFTLDLKRDR